MKIVKTETWSLEISATDAYDLIEEINDMLDKNGTRYETLAHIKTLIDESHNKSIVRNLKNE